MKIEEELVLVLARVAWMWIDKISLWHVLLFVETVAWGGILERITLSKSRSKCLDDNERNQTQ